MVSTFSSAALRHFRFWSISLICSSISRQRLLVIVTGIAQARLWGGRKVKREHSKKTSSKMGGKKLFKKWEENTTMVMICHVRGEGNAREAQIYICTSTHFVMQGPEGANRKAVHACPCPTVPQPIGEVVKTEGDLKAVQPLQCLREKQTR